MEFSTEDLLAAVCRHAITTGKIPLRVRVDYIDGEFFQSPIKITAAISFPPPEYAPEAFVPNKLQRQILDALDGEAMTCGQLTEALKVDKRRLFKNPGGIQELTKNDRIKNHKRLGYYRPDSPPEELENGDGEE